MNSFKDMHFPIIKQNYLPYVLMDQDTLDDYKILWVELYKQAKSKVLLGNIRRDDYLLVNRYNDLPVPG